MVVVEGEEVRRELIRRRQVAGRIIDELDGAGLASASFEDEELARQGRS
jgi:hypothetical protein